MTWHDAGPISDFHDKPLHHVVVGRKALAISHVDGVFGAVSGVCNHVGGPLGKGRLDGAYIVCPWHNWKFHRETGLGEPGYEGDAVPRHEVKVEGGHLWVNLEAASKRSRLPHDKHPLDREPERAPGPLRVLGISTTAMDAANPRISTSDALLECALEHATSQGAQTRHVKLNDLRFRACEGYYSKHAEACTWPCSITQMDRKDQMDQVYEGVVFWADVILVATPIRWGGAGSLYYRMVERLNCVQNQITIRDRVLMRNKVASFIITGGQDNVQAVAGQMLTFWGEIGCHFPQFPFVGHSRGWSAEDMDRNIAYVMSSEELRIGSRALVDRALELSHKLVEHEAIAKTERRGRKGSGIVETAPP